MVPAPMVQLLSRNVSRSHLLSRHALKPFTIEPPAAGPSSKPATTAQGSTTNTINQSSTKPHNPNFFFGGDVEEDEEDQTADNDQDAEQNGEGEEGEEDKEDDLETAFQMLDMARAILSKLDSDEAKLKLAGVHNALGEVATESGSLRLGLSSMWPRH